MKVPLSEPGRTYTFGGVVRNDGVQIANLCPSQVSVRNDVVARGMQEVVFYWSPQAEQHLQDIAQGTLSAALSAADLDQFVADVKAETRRVFTDLYQPFNVVLAEQASPGSDGVAGSETVFVIFGDRDAILQNGARATTIENTLSIASYVKAIPDFNNQRKQQNPRIFLGVLKQEMLSGLGGPNFIDGTGAELSDSSQLRVRDLGVALGHLAVHEVGHTLGLVSHDSIFSEIGAQIAQAGLAPNATVGESYARTLATGFGVRQPLPELNGCRVGHSCPEYDEQHALADRFGDGYYIMDPGEEMAIHELFGFADAVSRTEKLPVWDNFSASYLSLVHPKP